MKNKNTQKADGMLVQVPTADGKGWMTFGTEHPNPRLDAYLKKAKLNPRAKRKLASSSQSNSSSAKS